MITTAVVLARGLGSRMRAEGAGDLAPEQSAAADRGHKALMPIGRHRLIDHALSSLADAGIEHVVLVVPPGHEEFSAHLRALAPSRLRIDLAVQEEARGTADAVAAARTAVGENSFLVVNGDNLYPVDVLRDLRAQSGHALVGFDRSALVLGGNVPADRVSAFALVEHRDGVLVDILEKPGPEAVAAAGPQAPVSMNCFAFTPEVFEACARITPSARGELEIVDAVRALPRVQVLLAAGTVLDLSRRDDISSVAEHLVGREVAL